MSFPNAGKLRGWWTYLGLTLAPALAGHLVFDAIDGGPAALVSQTFSASNTINSGRVALAVSLTLDGIKQRTSLESYHLYHAIRGAFAAELGQVAAALTSFRQAENLATLPAERDFIARRIEECGGTKA